MSFKTLLHDEIVSIIATLTKASKALIAALLPVLKADLSTLIAKILPIASGVVLELATTGKSGADKRTAAFEQIKAAATAAGIQATSQAINIAIELAVANLPKTASPVVPDQAAS